MAEENLDWMNLDAIWISHFHLDHCGGLAPFLFGTKHAPETHLRRKPLKIFGAAGLRDLIEAFDRAYDYGLLKQPFPVEVIEIEPLEIFEILPGVKAVAISTKHTAESCAIRIEDADEKSLVFTSDTGPSNDLSALAKNADLFVLECSFVKNKPIENHLELTEAIYLIRRANPKKAMLAHFYPEWDAVNFVEETEKFLANIEIIEAKDGLTLIV